MNGHVAAEYGVPLVTSAGDAVHVLRRALPDPRPGGPVNGYVAAGYGVTLVGLAGDAVHVLRRALPDRRPGGTR